MAAAKALLTGIRDLQRQLQALEALASDEAATARELNTPEVARLLGISSEALTSWARTAGIGARRDGFQLVGRSGNGPRPHWIWKAEPTNG